MNNMLLCIDVQNDFCDPKGSLYVKGAVEDCQRLSWFIDENHFRITSIVATLDSHHVLDIAHPRSWVDKDGKHPPHFTIIKTEDVIEGRYMVTIPSLQDKYLEYVKALDEANKFKLCIWPEHCIIGTSGQQIESGVWDSMYRWMTKNMRNIHYVTKGSNPYTEHYSAIKAEVVDPFDGTTDTNQKLIDFALTHNRIYIAGQALSHCVRETVLDMMKGLTREQCEKFYLIVDCCSNVPGFECYGKEFVAKFIEAGGKVTNYEAIIP